MLDVDRYATLRAHDIAYVQVTKEKLRQPRALTGEVFRTIRARGYDGPPPDFGPQWRALFAPVSALVGSRRDYLQGLASGTVS